MTATRIMRLAHISLLPRHLTPTDPQRQQRRKKEENTIHDTKRKRRLEHRTRFINIDTDAIERRGAKDAEGDAVRVGGFQRCAVCAADAAQVVDAGDEGAYEAQVDEGDEVGVGARAVVGEERGDGPDGGEHGDDEEDEDVGGGEFVVFCVDVDEPG